MNGFHQDIARLAEAYGRAKVDASVLAALGRRGEQQDAVERLAQVQGGRDSAAQVSDRDGLALGLALLSDNPGNAGRECQRHDPVVEKLLRPDDLEKHDRRTRQIGQHFALLHDVLLRWNGALQRFTRSIVNRVRGSS